MVQDLRAIHPKVLNPYTILTQVPGDPNWFTVLGLKDAFLCIPLSEQTQPPFGLERASPSNPKAAPLTWTVLPQGFRKNSPLFRATLGKDLRGTSSPRGTIIQYVDDILICSPSKETSDSNSTTLPNFLADRGYWVSPKKTQISRQKLQYLGYELTPGHRTLSTDRKKAILDLGPPQLQRNSSSLPWVWQAFITCGFLDLGS